VGGFASVLRSLQFTGHLPVESTFLVAVRISSVPGVLRIPGGEDSRRSWKLGDSRALPYVRALVV
jgi:hypothetical protein